MYVPDNTAFSKESNAVETPFSKPASVTSTSAPAHCNSRNNADVQMLTLEEMNNLSFDVGWRDFCRSTSHKDEMPSLHQPSECESSFVKKDRNETSIILVDSRELASGKPLISSLRNRHKIDPVVMHLSTSDYVVSNRTAVERVLDSEFSNCPMPPKIIEKIRETNEMYDKLAVIIEKDSRKSILGFKKNVTKYLQFVTRLNCVPHMTVLFSNSAEHTSDLIANLVQQEKIKGFHINVPVVLDSKSKKLLFILLQHS